jgi:hypothetical protein
MLIRLPELSLGYEHRFTEHGILCSGTRCGKTDTNQGQLLMFPRNPIASCS